MTDNVPPSPSRPRLRRWIIAAVFLLTAVLVALGGMLGVSIMERRWEAMRPQIILQPMAEWEPNNAVWGRNYPREYESYALTAESSRHTKYGGSFPRDYLDEDPTLVVLFAGYGFSKDYRQARGHYHAVEDANASRRITPASPATCWTCKSTDVPRMMAKVGVKEFYASSFSEMKKNIVHPIGCQDCHDPRTMNLRITRPALREAFSAMGKDIDKASHQEMRSLVCAQCHVEYYFKNVPAEGKKNYLTFPWHKGQGVEAMIDYYDEIDFTDWVHPISKTPILKAQHPDYEMYVSGVHAYRNVSCVDCHMPYRTEGGVKFTDHHVQSPLMNIANSCAVCHRWSEQEIRARVETIQDKVFEARRSAGQAVAKAHFDIAAAMQAGSSDADLAAARKLLRHAQFRWDYVAANNGMGFHSPQESMRVCAKAIEQAQEVRVLTARLLAGKGIAAAPNYPDCTTRQKAWEAASAFVAGKAPKLVGKAD